MNQGGNSGEKNISQNLNFNEILSEQSSRSGAS